MENPRHTSENINTYTNICSQNDQTMYDNLRETIVMAFIESSHSNRFILPDVDKDARVYRRQVYIFLHIESHQCILILCCVFIQANISYNMNI